MTAKWDFWVKACGQPTVWTGFDLPEISETYVVLPQEGRCAQLHQALRDILDLHGRPHREEWMNELAYQHACEVHERCAAAIRKGK